MRVFLSSPASIDHLSPLWRAALALFHEHRSSLQSERTLIQSRRLRDELDYAHTFQFDWPGSHASPQPCFVGDEDDITITGTCLGHLSPPVIPGGA